MKIGVIIIVIALLLIGGFLLFFYNSGDSSDSGAEGDFFINEVGENVGSLNNDLNDNLNNREDEIEDISSEHAVEFSSSGYFPSTLTIKIGDTINFVNEDVRLTWPASDIHPTHTVYPGSSISKCGTSEENKIFDACKGLQQGESYSFTFNEAGTWSYHDHLSPGKKGTIIVE